MNKAEIAKKIKRSPEKNYFNKEGLAITSTGNTGDRVPTMADRS